MQVCTNVKYSKNLSGDSRGPESLVVVQLLGVSGSHKCPHMHSSTVVSLRRPICIAPEALHSQDMPRMVADVYGTCGAQMKLGANDTGRLFNWHPVRFALANYSAPVLSETLVCTLLQSAAHSAVALCDRC